MEIIVAFLVLAVFSMLGLLVLMIPFGVFSVPQGTVAVITTFGKYSRVARPGLAYRIPIVQRIQSRVSVRFNQSAPHQ